MRGAGASFRFREIARRDPAPKRRIGRISYEGPDIIDIHERGVRQVVDG